MLLNNGYLKMLSLTLWCHFFKRWSEIWVCESVCVCVCVWGREREREGDTVFLIFILILQLKILVEIFHQMLLCLVIFLNVFF